MVRDNEEAAERYHDASGFGDIPQAVFLEGTQVEWPVENPGSMVNGRSNLISL